MIVLIPFYESSVLSKKNYFFFSSPVQYRMLYHFDLFKVNLKYKFLRMTETKKEEKEEPPAPVRAASADAFYICDKFGMKASNINGYLYPPFVTSKGVKWLRDNFITDIHDIIITTFPKTGTMWTLNIVIEMIKEAYPLQTIYKTIKQGEWIENLASNKGIEYFKQFTEISTKYDAEKCPKRVWQTHAFHSQFPCKKLNKNTKIIYVTRSPKDVIVSSFHFFSKEPNIAYKGDFETFFECFCDGITVNGNYFDHVMEWYRVKQNAKNLGINILFLYYEDMKEDLLREIKKIAKFLECDQLLNDSKYKIIENASTFHAMKTASKSDDVHLSPAFFRKGISKDWKNYMTSKQSQRIDRLIRTRFYGTDIKYYQQLLLANNNTNVNKSIEIIDNLISLISSK